MLRAARFLNSYFRYPFARTEDEEVRISLPGGEVGASLIRPHRRGIYPGWVVLHGMTVTGRSHPALQKFAHSLAASGSVVLIPEVPSWSGLTIDTAAGDATVLAASSYLASRPDVRTPLSLMGFSFGATQALVSSTLPGARDAIGSVVAFGGYADLRSTLAFMLTGEHLEEGRGRRVDPDPYGRWVAVANSLLDVPGLGHMEDLVRAARNLALETGRHGIFAGDPRYDGLKAELRTTLAEDEQRIWDLIASPSGIRAPVEAGRELADDLASAALRKNPDLDPRERLRHVDRRVILAHGLDDLLIPYTETLRLRSWLPPRTRATVSITRLFTHSRGAGRLGMIHYPREFARYFALLRRALAPVPSGRRRRAG